MKMSKEKEWLPHLEYSIPKEAYGFSTSMYSIALEAWRRGLTVRFINKNQIKSHTEFIISNKQKRFRFSGSRGNIVSKEAINTCADKYQTKELLKEYEVPVVDGELFTEDATDEEIIKFAESFGYPVVIKPYNGNSGDGVVVNIQDEQTLREAIIHVRQELGYTRILVERFIDSRDYQLYIIDNEVVAAFERVSANVIGDGEKTIQQLIKQKNNERKRNPSLNQHLIKRKNELLLQKIHEQGYTLDSVPEKDELVTLRYKSNIAAGGETIDITEELSNNIKNMAINAVDAIPELPICAVEIIVDKNSEKGYVLELKTQPTISGHLFPSKGQARDVAKELIDFYFPETQDANRDEQHYFDFEHVFEIFNENCVQEYTLPRVPKGDIESKKYIINGLVDRKKFIDSVKPRLMNNELNGFFSYRRNGKLTLVISGNVEAVEIANSIINVDNEEMKKDDFEIIEKEWTTPVKIGFEVKRKKRDLNREKRLRKRLQAKSSRQTTENKEEQSSITKLIDSIKTFGK